MATSTRTNSAAFAGHPVYTTLTAFPFACFTLALLTDIAYWQSANLMWQNFSAWLLLAGLVGGGFAAIAWLVGVALHRTSADWLQAVVNFLVLAVAVVNSLVHAGDGWTAVVPWGIALSVATVLLMLVSALLGRRASVHT